MISPHCHHCFSCFIANHHLAACLHRCFVYWHYRINHHSHIASHFECEFVNLGQVAFENGIRGSLHWLCDGLSVPMSWAADGRNDFVISVVISSTTTVTLVPGGRGWSVGASWLEICGNWDGDDWGFKICWLDRIRDNWDGVDCLFTYWGIKQPAQHSLLAWLGRERPFRH